MGNKLMAVMRSFTEKDFKEMALMILFGFTAFMLLQPTEFAYASEGGSLNGVLQNIGGVAGIVGGIVLVIVLVKGIADYVKGDGTIGKIVVKVLCILLLIGLILVATNISSLQNTFSSIASSGVDVVSDTAGEILG